jgi:hypothetical protein
MATWFGDLVFGAVATALGVALVFNVLGVADQAIGSTRFSSRPFARSTTFWKVVGIVWLVLGVLALLAAASSLLRK